MTPAEPARADPPTTGKRLKAAAFGLVGALLAPLPAAAAPAPCEQAERYAAQSGAGLMRIGKLDLGPAGRTDKPITDVGVGDAKSALVAQAIINSAAITRMLDGGPTDRKALTDVLQQTAPPSNKKPSSRDVKATEVGPLRLGVGTMTTHAQWDAGMACGNVVGDVTRSETELSRAGILEDGDGALVRVPRKISSLSTTALERRGSGARAVAAASLAGDDVEVLGGAVKVKIVKAPSLVAGMSTKDGGEIRYVPAVIEVSGEGIEASRLDTAGDDVELTLNGDRHQRHATKNGPSKGGVSKDGGSSKDLAGKDIVGRSGGGASRAGEGSPDKDSAGKSGGDDGAAGAGLFGRLPKLGALESGSPLPLPGLPSLPGVPPISGPGTEGTPAAAAPGTTVKIALGDVRQAASEHAIAAKATAMSITITQGPGKQGYGHGGGVVLDLDIGLLEVAAVAPEPVGGGVSSAAGGSGGGLPITGPRVDVIALTGVALLLAGAVALVFGMRGRSGS